MAFKTIVNSEEYPNIVEALNLVAVDNGGLSLPVHEIPLRWKEFLPQVEAALATLSRTERAPESPPLAPHVKPSPMLDSEFYTFCNGEESEQIAISNRDLNMARATVFLNDAFEDWTITSEGGPDVPENEARKYRIGWLETVARESSLGLSPDQQLELERLYQSLT